MKSKDDLTGSVVEGAVQDRRPGHIKIERKGLLDMLTASFDGRKSISYFKIRKKWKQIYENEKKLQKSQKRAKYKKLRFFLLVSTAFMMVVAIVYYSILFINDVILYESDFHINEQGTINPRKSLNCDYALFLFNTSDVWANPGIQIHEKDKIRINISGGFNSSIKDVMECSRENDSLRYKWMYNEIFWKKADPNEYLGLNYCLSRGKEYIIKDTLLSKTDTLSFRFGSILYTIEPESADLNNHPFKADTANIRIWRAGDLKKTYDGDRDFFEAKRSGYLYFSINDLVFDGIDYLDSIDNYFSRKEDSINQILTINKEAKRIICDESLYNSKINQFLQDTIILNSLNICIKANNTTPDSSKIEGYLDTIITKCKIHGDKICLPKVLGYIEEFGFRNNIILKEDSIDKERVKKDPMFFYKDNLGQLLVAVEIQRYTPLSWLKPEMLFRTFEYWINKESEKIDTWQETSFNFGDSILGKTTSFLVCLFIRVFFIILLFLWFCINVAIKFFVWILLLWAVVGIIYLVYNLITCLIYSVKTYALERPLKALDKGFLLKRKNKTKT